MIHGTYKIEQFLIYALAVALALAVAVMPVPANSGAYTSDNVNRVGPRWSNSQHHEQGLIVRPDCVALPPGADAQYVAGRDAWGRPVIPADPPKAFKENFPVEVELDVTLDSKHIAGKEIELHAGRFTFDPASNEVSLNGRKWQRDCLPSSK